MERKQQSRCSKELKHIEELVENAWLGLDPAEQIVKSHVFSNRTRDDVDNPHIYLLKLLRNPENFYFTCKYIFGVHLLPFQLAILQELWHRKYPMLIASRGAGKCITGDSLVITNDGFKEIGDLVGYDAPEMCYRNIPNTILNEKKGFNNIEYGWNNGFSNTVKLTTSQGYSIEGTNNHPIRVYRNNTVVWCDLKDITINDYVLIDRKEEWFPNTNDIEPDLGYLFGLLVGDGGYTVRGRISFTSADDQLHETVDKLALKYFGKGFNETPSSEYSNHLYSTEIWDSLFKKYGFVSFECGKKQFPKSILGAKKETVAAFIRGLFDTDGTVSKRRKMLEYASKSLKLVKTMQIVLAKFGIICKIKPRLNQTYNTYYYYLYISGDNVNIFKDKIGFGLLSKKNILEEMCEIQSNTNIDILPNNNHRFKSRQKFLSIDKAIKEGLIENKNYFFDKVSKLEEGFAQTFDVHCLEDHSFISNCFVSHNSFMLALYAMLRAFLHQGCKIIIVGSSFRQSKVIFEYCETIWNNAPVLRSLVENGAKTGPKTSVDRCTCYVGISQIIALPIGDGQKIRGQRANYIIADEFASMSEAIYENVISGFAAVRADVVDTVKNFARIKMLKSLGYWTDADERDAGKENMGNQAILAGTAYYDFNHFAKYWKRYKQIILSKGDKDKLKEIFQGEVPESFNYRDYSVIRLPYELLPPGFMDEKHVARSKATVYSGIYNMEFGATFATDSNGFFKRSLIESCVTHEPILLSNGEKVHFHAQIRGTASKKYVIGVDPASEQDNFSIVVIELHNGHRRIVYCWTTNRGSYKERLKVGLAEDQDFYGFAARKIRDLMLAFPCENIIMDSQGGGVAVEEALQDSKRLKPGEQPIWKVIDEDEPAPTDEYPGLHILTLANFAKAEWTRDANHGLRKDFEDKLLLFPFFDSLSLGFAIEEDREKGKMYDNLEDCVAEIEELKDELASIVHTQTGIAGRDKWDTPEVKLPGGKKGRLRKDRYSALLMANSLARGIQKVNPTLPDYECVGGFVDKINTKNKSNNSYDIAPSWFKASNYGGGVAVNKSKQ